MWFQRDASWPRPWQREFAQPVLFYGGQTSRSGPHQGPVWPATRGEFEKIQFARRLHSSVTHTWGSCAAKTQYAPAAARRGSTLCTSYAYVHIYLISIYVLHASARRLGHQLKQPDHRIHNTNKDCDESQRLDFYFALGELILRKRVTPAQFLFMDWAITRRFFFAAFCSKPYAALYEL